MLNVEPEHIVNADFLYDDWDPALVSLVMLVSTPDTILSLLLPLVARLCRCAVQITSLLDQATPTHARIDLQTSSYAQLSDQLSSLGHVSSSVEPWFSVAASSVGIPDGLLHRCAPFAARHRYSTGSSNDGKWIYTCPQ